LREVDGRRFEVRASRAAACRLKCGCVCEEEEDERGAIESE